MQNHPLRKRHRTAPDMEPAHRTLGLESAEARPFEGLATSASPSPQPSDASTAAAAVLCKEAGFG